MVESVIECRDVIDRRDEKGCDDGRWGDFCGNYCVIIVQNVWKMIENGIDNW